MARSVAPPAAPAGAERAAAEIGRIVEQLVQLHDGGAWHGPSVGEALDGVSAADAARRPIGSAHSIWEIVRHVRGVDEQVRRDLLGEGASDEPDWPVPGAAEEASWRAAVDGLKRTQRALRDAVAAFPAARLHDLVPGKPHSFWYEVLGVLHHDAYHA